MTEAKVLLPRIVHSEQVETEYDEKQDAMIPESLKDTWQVYNGDRLNYEIYHRHSSPAKYVTQHKEVNSYSELEMHSYDLQRLDMARHVHNRIKYVTDSDPDNGTRVTNGIDRYTMETVRLQPDGLYRHLSDSRIAVPLQELILTTTEPQLMAIIAGPNSIIHQLSELTNMVCYVASSTGYRSPNSYALTGMEVITDRFYPLNSDNDTTITVYSTLPEAPHRKFYLSFTVNASGLLIGQVVRTPYIPFRELPGKGEAKEVDALGNLQYVRYYDPAGSGRQISKPEYTSYYTYCRALLASYLPTDLVRLLDY